MTQMRLDKFLANRTPYSRAEVKNLLRAGSIQVDGITERDGSRKLDADAQTVTCRGQMIRGGAHVYLLLNKPVGYLSATEDRTQKTVMELVPDALRVKGLAPAGRLDIDSTGMLLLTDDGVLAHRMLAPKQHVPKCYLIGLARPCEASYAQRLAAGITLADGTECLPAELMPVDMPGHFALIRLHEGKYHQVRRMMAALGNHVETLHRTAIGELLLPPDLPFGGCLEILHKDVEKMLKPGDFPALYEQIVSYFSSYLINGGQ